MPILKAEPCQFPDNLFEDLPCLSGERQWWAVCTKPRQEKALARQLLAMQIPFYLPLAPKDNFFRGRRIQSQLPLFSGYLFLLGSDEERGVTVTTNRVAHFLPVRDSKLLLTDLHQVRRLIEIKAPLTVERQLEPGRKVRIKSGPMEGLEGTISARRGGVRLLVRVHFLQAGVSVEIDDYMVEPVD